jgi:hypothetical protein
MTTQLQNQDPLLPWITGILLLRWHSFRL